MLDWYDSEKGSSKHRKKVEFDTCKMLHGESVTIYCLRLERLSRKAFPDDRRERERNMYNKARETFPAALIEKIDNAQGLADAFGGSRLNWRNMKKLAENFDRINREKGADHVRALSAEGAQMYVNEFRNSRNKNEVKKWTSHESERSRRDNRQYQPANVNLGQGACPKSKNSWSPTCAPRVSFVKETNVCTWCNKQGHSEQMCWRKNNACLLCGSKHHFLKDCVENQMARAPDVSARREERSSHSRVDYETRHSENKDLN